MPSSVSYNQLSIYLDAAEIMQHGVMFLDKEGNVLSVNKRFAQELGHSKEQFEPKTIFQINPHFNFIAWKKLWEELTENGQMSLETEHLTSAGKMVPVKLRGILLHGEVCQAIVEGDLTESQEDLYLARFCLDNVHEMITWVGEDGYIFYANKAAREVLGYTGEELSRMKIWDIEPGFSEADWKQEWEALKTRKWFKRETVRRNVQGDIFPVELSMHYMNYNGREYKMAFVRDLREQKQREKLINLSYHSLDQAHQMIYWTDSNGKIIYANQCMFKVMGYEVEELTGMHIAELEPTLEEDAWLQRWNALKEKGTLELDTVRHKKNGDPIPVRLFLNYFTLEGKEYNLGFASDRSNRKKLEEDIKLSFETLNNAPDPVFWLNKDSTFRYFNATFAEMTGYSHEEITRMHLLDFFPDFQKTDFEQSWERLKKGKLVNRELEITIKSGEKIFCQALVKMMTFEGKQYSCTVLRDIREQKQQELELKKRLEDIERLRLQAQEENIILKEEIQVEQGSTNIISQSAKYKKVLQQIGQVADTAATVLVLGETGTGKELIAKAIHSLSNRADKPMVKVNCSALPENLIESELFGHEKGAFTGAFQRKIGRFEMAHKGTLFLDEIGELPLDLQAKLLRVLQEGEFERVGSTDTIKVDVRIIAATNRNLEERAERGEFREDLFYRLNVFPIYSLPLRERKEDIRPLVRHFIEKYNTAVGKHVETIPESAIRELEEYEFPGNVRELENLIERAVILSPGSKLVANFQFKKAKSGAKSVFKSMEDMQREHILEALRRTNGKISGSGSAAELLGMNDKTLYSRMDKFGIKRHDYTR